MALCGLLVFAGCKKKVATADSPVKRTFKASIGGDGGKTSLNPSTGAVYWTDGDQIKVNGTSLTLGEGEGTTMGSFSGSVSGDYYVGAYPADNATVNSYTEGSERVTFTLPATQTLTENSFGSGANPMVAKSSTTDIAFRNVCGGLCIRIWATSGSADKIVVTSKSGAKLNGTYTVDYSGDTPTTSLSSDGTDVITMTGDAVTLSTDEDDPTKFFVMLPVGTYTGGFNVKVYSGETKILDKDFATATSIERNNIKLYAITQAAASASVTTSAVNSIGTTTATGNGNVTSDGGATITERGVCWNTTGSPTVSDSKASNGTGTGAYTVSMTGLTEGTTYYVRAYAINTLGTVFYGSEVSFGTKGLPTVTTTAVSEIGVTIATSGGNVTFDGNCTVSARGICWSTSTNPTIESNLGMTVNDSGTGEFESSITGLTKGTTYHVRAYATNEIGTAYGEDLLFTTVMYPNGCISGLFTVNSSGKEVYFAKGNLIAVAENTWGFDDNQWDTHTDDGSTISTDYPRYYFKWDEVVNSSDNPKTFTIGGVIFTLLTKAEWACVLGWDGNARGGSSVSPSGHFYVKATVNEKFGVIILPDNWSDSYFSFTGYNTTGSVSNTVTAAQWATLEEYGCVFLPAAGFSYNNNTESTNNGWIMTASEESGAKYMAISLESGKFLWYDTWKATISCVQRLVVVK